MRHERKANPGVLRENCTLEEVKQRIDFMIQDMHLTKPCTEYSRYMVKVVEIS